jgi:hypothetical protein
MMALAHTMGEYASVMLIAGALTTGLTVLSSFTAARVYRSEHFRTALRGRGHFFGEATAIGACIPLAFGKETAGQLALVTEDAEEPAGDLAAEPVYRANSGGLLRPPLSH